MLRLDLHDRSIPSTPTPYSARASAATASAASIKSMALGGLSLAAGIAAFAAVQPEARPAMCAAPASAERTCESWDGVRGLE